MSLTQTQTKTERRRPRSPHNSFLRSPPPIATPDGAAITNHGVRQHLRELRRVARRVVVFQWDNTRIGDFWLVRDYLPEFFAATRDRPTLVDRAAAINATVDAVPIPWDYVDGFFHCYWRRPHAYLQEPVRRGSSVWA